MGILHANKKCVIAELEQALVCSTSSPLSCCPLLYTFEHNSTPPGWLPDTVCPILTPAFDS
jgi:hypothetical protein